MLFYARSLIVFTGMFLISGCYNGAPGHFPRGYSSYDEVYKSAPGAAADGIGYNYDAQENKTIVNDMRFAARDLIENLDDELSYSVDAVYLDVPKLGAFYNSFDHLLRNELTQQGYLLSDSSEGYAKVTFSAQEKPICDDKQSNMNHVYRKLYLALVLHMPHDDMPKVVSGFYDVPTYGYEPSPNESVVLATDCEMSGNVPVNLLAGE